jgi:hypothetical protein
MGSPPRSLRLGLAAVALLGSPTYPNHHHGAHAAPVPRIPGPAAAPTAAAQQRRQQHSRSSSSSSSVVAPQTAATLRRRHLASASSDGTACGWERHAGFFMSDFAKHPGQVHHAVFGSLGEAQADCIAIGEGCRGVTCESSEECTVRNHDHLRASTTAEETFVKIGCVGGFLPDSFDDEGTSGQLWMAGAGETAVAAAAEEEGGTPTASASDATLPDGSEEEPPQVSGESVGSADSVLSALAGEGTGDAAAAPTPSSSDSSGGGGGTAKPPPPPLAAASGASSGAKSGGAAAAAGRAATVAGAGAAGGSHGAHGVLPQARPGKVWHDRQAPRLINRHREIL